MVGIGLLIPFYFKAVSSTAERSAKNKTDKVAKKNRRISVKGKRRFSLYRTFLHKEILTTVRDPHQLSSTISSFFVLPIVSYVMNYLLDAINTNPLGDYMVIAFNIMISASLLSAFNIECAYALSSEGLEFAILKTAPSNTAAMVWGKITVTLVSNFVAIAATTAMLYFTTEIKVLDLILLSVTLFLLAMSMVLWSFQLDVRRPQFSEYASKGSAGVVDNPNVALATLLGFIIATLAGALTLLMLYDDYITGWLRILGITLGVCVARIYLFSRNLQVYFKELEL